jgi:hypothetical protein
MELLPVGPENLSGYPLSGGFLPHGSIPSLEEKIGWELLPVRNSLPPMESSRSGRTSRDFLVDDPVAVMELLPVGQMGLLPGASLSGGFP